MKQRQAKVWYKFNIIIIIIMLSLLPLILVVKGNYTLVAIEVKIKCT